MVEYIADNLKEDSLSWTFEILLNSPLKIENFGDFLSTKFKEYNHIELIASFIENARTYSEVTRGIDTKMIGKLYQKGFEQFQERVLFFPKSKNEENDTFQVREMNIDRSTFKDFYNWLKSQ